MAQNDLNVNILANVKGAEQIATLINRVGALEKEMNSLQRANSGVAASTEAVIRNGVRYNNALDAQSKELRRARQGTQQLGMQINDFATSVSTGASPIQAFNQQLGQVGIAMSQMGGKLGAVGNFMMGPWGTAITVVTMALGFLAQKFLFTGDEAKKTQSKISDLGQQFDFTKMSAEDLARVNELLANENKKVAQTAIQAANATAAQADANANAVAKELNLAKAKAETLRVDLAILRANRPISGRDFEVGRATQTLVEGNIQAVEGSLKEIENRLAGFQMASRRATAEVYSLSSALDKNGEATELHQSRLNLLRNAYASDQISLQRYREELQKVNAAYEASQVSRGGGKKGRSADRQKAVSETDKLRAAQKAIIDQFEKDKLAPAEFEKQLKAVTEAHREAINPADEYLKKFQEQDRALKAFMTTAESLVQKQLPDWEQKLNNLNEQYAKIVGTTRQTEEATLAYGQAIQAVLLGPIDAQIAKYDEMIAKANGVSESFAATSAAIVQRAMAEGASLEEINARLTVLQQKMGEFKIAERNAEIRKSFESIGMSVNDAFKGMLTGAMSWKDGMKGIINAVINELWRLFVVQQIVGMVSNALSGAFGFGGGGAGGASAFSKVTSVSMAPGKLGPAFANGTVNAPGGMAWVGERGPELVNLPRGSQVIPAHRAQSMGGGGMTINVDARGANDPAAVRAQVQRGILEAAPAIIAAAEARTVSGLRRPRLGSVMK